MTLYLRDDFRAAVGLGDAPDAFAALAALDGDVRRQGHGRRTLRLVVDGAAYFAKQHTGVGWREILKCWLSGKRPVLGAGDEFVACRRLAARGVPAPTVAAFGERGRNPATRRSFVVCDALEGFAGLDEIAGDWLAAPPAPAIKRRLAAAAGELTRAMHDAGVCHRDFYLDHLLADRGRLAAGDVLLAVIDLHRAVVRRRVTRRGRRRDLGALLYSATAAALAPSRADLLRFVAAYADERPAAALRRDRGFWRGVERRARRLRARGVAKGIAMRSDAAGVNGETAATAGRLADLRTLPSTPFRFDADFGAGGVRVPCERVLRLRPGRELVAAATVAGGDAIVKAFFGWRAGDRLAREKRGMAVFASAGVATPALLGVGRGGGARVLAWERVDGARAPRPADAGALLAALARLHERGWRAGDLRLGHFLVRGGVAVAVDGRALGRRWRLRRAPVGRRGSRRDIARLLAQFPAESEPLCAAARGAYDAARGEPLGDAEWRAMPMRVAGARRAGAVDG